MRQSHIIVGTRIRMMVKKDLLGLGIEETGCHIADTTYYIEIKTAQDIGLINKILGFLRGVIINLDVIGTWQPLEEIRG